MDPGECPNQGYGPIDRGQPDAEYPSGQDNATAQQMATPMGGGGKDLAGTNMLEWQQGFQPAIDQQYQGQGANRVNYHQQFPAAVAQQAPVYGSGGVDYGTHPAYSGIQTGIPANHMQHGQPTFQMGPSPVAHPQLPAVAALPPPAPRPSSVEEMINSRTGTCHTWIQGLVDLENVRGQFLATGNVSGTNVADFPMQINVQCRMVKELHDAVHDLTDAIEPQGSQSYNRIQNNHFSDLDMELILWDLFISTWKAQAGICQLPPYSGRKKLVHNAFDSFNARFEAVKKAVRESKDAVMSLFKDSAFVHRLAWCPVGEVRQKSVNRRLNDDKSTQNEVGIVSTHRFDMKRNELGQLVDVEGFVFAKARQETAKQRETRSTSKRRPRDSLRLEFARRTRLADEFIDTQTIAEDDHKEEGGSAAEVEKDSKQRTRRSTTAKSSGRVSKSGAGNTEGGKRRTTKKRASRPKRQRDESGPPDTLEPPLQPGMTDGPPSGFPAPAAPGYGGYGSYDPSPHIAESMEFSPAMATPTGYGLTRAQMLSQSLSSGYMGAQLQPGFEWNGGRDLSSPGAFNPGWSPNDPLDADSIIGQYQLMPGINNAETFGQYDEDADGS